jgi:hypothetical protein
MITNETISAEPVYAAGRSMSINGVVTSEPVYANSRIKFTLACDETRREVFCVTELEFGQFGPVSRGDHVSLTGTMAHDNLEGHESFCADSITPIVKNGRRIASHS